jgi:hypothetical protein
MRTQVIFEKKDFIEKWREPIFLKSRCAIIQTWSSHAWGESAPLLDRSIGKLPILILMVNEAVELRVTTA